MKKHLLYLSLLNALFVLSAATNCGDLLECGDACYDSNDYKCYYDGPSGKPVLCPVGTENCAGNCIATCGYTCNNGQIKEKSEYDNTCPPVCNVGTFPCGDQCYDGLSYCCIGGMATPASHCPNYPEYFKKTSECNFILADVGQLWNGQLRASFGPGANYVSFSLKDGVLTDNRGQICYSSPNFQLQCNTVPQTSDYQNFGISQGGFLLYKGNAVFFQSSVGTGGYNIYTQQIGNAGGIALKVEYRCPTPPRCNYFSLDNIGQLAGGQIRYNFGEAANPVDFTLFDGVLYDNRTRICYISEGFQLQCDFTSQTLFYNSFGTKDGFLTYYGDIDFYKTATGTGGFNIFTRPTDTLSTLQNLKLNFKCDAE